MERKECNAEGKRSACQKKQTLFQLCLTKFPHIHIIPGQFGFNYPSGFREEAS